MPSRSAPSAKIWMCERSMGTDAIPGRGGGHHYSRLAPRPQAETAPVRPTGSVGWRFRVAVRIPDGRDGRDGRVGRAGVPELRHRRRPLAVPRVPEHRDPRRPTFRVRSVRPARLRRVRHRVPRPQPSDARLSEIYGADYYEPWARGETPTSSTRSSGMTFAPMLDALRDPFPEPRCSTSGARPDRSSPKPTERGARRYGIDLNADAIATARNARPRRRRSTRASPPTSPSRACSSTRS